MKQFFKMVFATITGILMAGGVLVLIAAIAIGVAVSKADSKDDTKVEENSILKLSFKGGLIDRASNDPFENFDFGSFKSKKQLSLKDVLSAIDRAKTDDKIKGIYLPLDDVNMNAVNMEELRNALLDFKESGKFTLAYGKTIGQGAYYLGSACEEVYLFPEGDLLFKGLASELSFFKGTLEKLDVEMQIIRGSNNKFKSAVEPFIYEKMSDANRAQMTRLLNGMWGHWTKNIAESRGLTVEEVNRIADSVATYIPEEAVKTKMIDGLKYRDELVADLMAKVEVEDEDDLEVITIGKYANASKPKKDDDEKDSWKIKNKVAVVYAAGEIIDGNGGDGKMGGDKIAKAIRKARQDSTVKAIVLRINSPGGSALASEVMWRETVLAKQEKPLVVSMGRLAASGGYYMACHADKIYASPNTITGSIGVFGMIPYVGEFFTNKMGVTFDGVKTNANSDVGILTKKLTPYQMRGIQKGVDKIYDTFITHVSEGRGLTKAEVDSIGQGRVWTGIDALELGLVDELGGLNDAIAHAVKMAELKDGDFKLKNYPEQKDPFEEFLKEMGMQGANAMAEWQLGEEYKYFKYVQNLTKRSTIQARMPFDIEVQ
jgi:protease-4